MSASNLTEKKEIIAKHLAYEVDMFRVSYLRLQSNPPDQTTINMLIECFCLHSRNLIDFFSGKKTKNLAVAREFADSSYNPFEGRSLKEGRLYQKLNDQISHITYGRTDDQTKKINGEDRAALKRLIEEEIENFTTHIDDAYHAHWHRRADLNSTVQNVQGSTATVTTTESTAYSVHIITPIER